MSASRRAGGRIVALCALFLGLGFAIEWLDPFPEARYLIQPSPETLPSTRHVPAKDIVAGTELLSVVLEESALSGPARGLLTHPNARGREWERQGYASYFTDEGLRLATRIGIRMHGGRSRIYSPVKSFRLYFRPSYGVPAVPASTFFSDSAANDLTRVIAHNDIRVDRLKREWHLVNPFAYDIATRLGGITPRTRPARFYLNGQPQGLYVITEHISPEFLEARFGHRDFSIDASGDREGLFAWARTAKPFTMRDADAVVDLDNLTSWALTILFCATTDVMTQSPLVRDRTDPAARWFWLTWDLDHSFMDLYQAAPQAWLLDSYQTILYSREARSRILTRLLFDDMDYRRYFSQRLSAALNHQLTPAFLQERFGFYREVALRRGAVDNGYLEALERFLEERPRALWNLTVKHLKTAEPYEVTVSGPVGAIVGIDGFRTPLPYKGTYLPGTPFVLDAGSTPAVDAWLVGGRLERDRRLSIAVTENLAIQAVSRAGN